MRVAKAGTRNRRTWDESIAFHFNFLCCFPSTPPALSTSRVCSYSHMCTRLSIIFTFNWSCCIVFFPLKLRFHFLMTTARCFCASQDENFHFQIFHRCTKIHSHTTKRRNLWRKSESPRKKNNINKMTRTKKTKFLHIVEWTASARRENFLAFLSSTNDDDADDPSHRLTSLIPPPPNAFTSSQISIFHTPNSYSQRRCSLVLVSQPAKFLHRSNSKVLCSLLRSHYYEACGAHYKVESGMEPRTGPQFKFSKIYLLSRSGRILEK